MAVPAAISDHIASLADLSTQTANMLASFNAMLASRSVYNAKIAEFKAARAVYEAKFVAAQNIILAGLQPGALVVITNETITAIQEARIASKNFAVARILKSAAKVSLNEKIVAYNEQIVLVANAQSQANFTSAAVLAGSGTFALADVMTIIELSDTSDDNPDTQNMVLGSLVTEVP